MFNFKGVKPLTGQAPYGANQRARKGAYPEPLPAVPHPESLAVRAAYTSNAEVYSHTVTFPLSRVLDSI